MNRIDETELRCSNNYYSMIELRQNIRWHMFSNNTNCLYSVHYILHGIILKYINNNENSIL